MATMITRSRLFWVKDLTMFDDHMGHIGVMVKHIAMDLNGVPPPRVGAVLVHVHTLDGYWPYLREDQTLSDKSDPDASQYHFYCYLREFLIDDEVAILEDLMVDETVGFDHRIVVILANSLEPIVRTAFEWDHDDLIRLAHHASHPPFPNDRAIEPHHLIRGHAKAV